MQNDTPTSLFIEIHSEMKTNSYNSDTSYQINLIIHAAEQTEKYNILHNLFTKFYLQQSKYIFKIWKVILARKRISLTWFRKYNKRITYLTCSNTRNFDVLTEVTFSKTAWGLMLEVNIIRQSRLNGHHQILCFSLSKLWCRNMGLDGKWGSGGGLKVGGGCGFLSLS